MDSTKNLAKDLMNILGRAMDAKIYGSIEIFLEEGSITQITQRIINKISKPKKPAKIIKTKVPKKNIQVPIPPQSQADF